MKIELNSFFDEIYETDEKGIPNFKIYSGGKWYFPVTGEFIDVRSPIDNSLVARISAASEEDADRVLNDAYKAKPLIRRMPAIDRMNALTAASQLIQQNFEALRNSIVINNGKTVADAAGEIKSTMHRLSLTFEETRKIFGDYIPGDWAEENVGKYALIIREPVGLVLAISPFNYPLFITFTKAIPALLAGNSVIIKPPSADPIPPILMTKIMQESGIPPAALSLVTGKGSLGSYMAESPIVDVVTFTGSTGVGKELTKISGIKKIHLELGGKGAAIILNDADLPDAATKTLAGSLKNAGQRCDAISRVLVQSGIYRDFCNLLAEGIKEWTAGDPRDEGSKIGPMISREAVNHVMELVEDAVNRGARLVHGGKSRENYMEATLLLDVPLEARIMWEETFGPVVPVHEFRTIDEAIEIANRSEYGLDSAVFTRDLNSAWKVAKRLEVGEVTINNYPAHGVGFFPFGGVKESGLGREGIGYSIDEFTNMKTIVFQTAGASIWETEKTPAEILSQAGKL
ncbi:MAG: aldehyde dehydrogenase family protein [Candidatus Thermoplasmatota archaeon]|nr:aldehyde dehydrogenase family protein [Candidatus Thermoplasmatota archaeon]